ncbi:SurA N-terminal domain-containing protein [Shewanella ulleungensis]|uniref:Periplasmic chaperone PpiD n=1 Tax=Shewanella ulleungensis TaxID=2282699 RepID=A0ABQ2QHT4_9GAMM|nr:SurA N-terminal domain-containing protein [Shewanella ulleungensis]MCL1151037.1 SurA N-terminal domain-containing protein [Shewanella ulleungensis]GGP82502.1 peptidylprolyl isomerase [Shewanella ulleungensis]
MLEKIREGSQGVVAKTILVLVILSFAFAGVSSYLGSNTGVPAAIVNGEEVSASELENAFQNERSRIEQQLGEMFNALAADDNYMNGIKQGVLDRLVADKLIDQAANKLGLRVSDEQIKKAIIEEPAFQTDGKFDNDRYLAVLRQLGYQTTSFRTMMRVDMTRRQLLNALVGSEFVLDGEAKQLAQVQGQTRDIRYLVVDSTPFLSTVSVSDEEAQTYYDANVIQFMSPEKVSLEYVELNAADMAQNSQTTDEEVQAYYDEHQSQYQTPEKRLAAHIFVAATDDESADKAKADAIAAKLNNGEDFAEVAKADSDDQLSAEQGGQLDWFEQGVMDPAFDEALFALQQGKVSPVVKSEFGYHIIKLLDIQASQATSFADVKAKIVAQLQEKKALDVFYGLQSKLADTSYEIPDTLSETAQAVGGKVQTTALFSRDNVPAQFNNPEFIKAAFSDQVLASGMNSDVIELAPNHVVVIRMKQHSMAGTMPFADVKAGISDRLKQDKANETAREKAAEFMAQLKAGNDTLSGATLTALPKLGRFNQDIDQAITDKAFKIAAPAANSVTIDTAALATGYAVIVVDKVNEAEGINDNLINTLKQRLAPQYSEADYRAVIATLKADAEIEYPVVE